jgi:hypothetical protein
MIESKTKKGSKLIILKTKQKDYYFLFFSQFWSSQFLFFFQIKKLISVVEMFFQDHDN